VFGGCPDCSAHCNCHKDRETGTKIPKRLCRIKFLSDAAAIDGAEFYRALTGPSVGRGVNAPHAVLQPLWQKRREEYLHTAKVLLEKNPDRLALAIQWGRLLGQYERVHKERHEDRIIVFE
jgi:hypothetical protein